MHPMYYRDRYPHLQRVLDRPPAATGRGFGGGATGRRFMRRRTGQEAALLAMAAAQGGYPQPHDIGPACRPRYSGPYPFEGIEACEPYGPYAECRDYVLPFDSVDPVPAGATVDIEQEPQVPFVGRRLVIGSSIAFAFLLNDLVVGKNSQFVSPGAISAETFSEAGVGVALAVDPAYPGKIITLRITNISGDDIRFNAAFIGNAVD